MSDGLRASRPRPASPPLWTTRCVALAVPVRARDRVLIVGGHPGVTRAVAAAAGTPPVTVLRTTATEPSAPLLGEVLSVTGGALPVEDAWADHVLVPILSQDIAGVFPTELARVARPGGALFVAAASKLHAPRSPAAWTFTRARRALQRNGFDDVRVFGIRQSIFRPRYLVPLDSPGALGWFYAAAHLPRSRAGALVTRAVRTLPSRRLQALPFPAFGYTAVRRGGQPVA